MKRDAKKANKLEKRLMTLNGGYEKRSAQLIKDIQDKFEKYQEAQRQLASFEKLEVGRVLACEIQLGARAGPGGCSIAQATHGAEG